MKTSMPNWILFPAALILVLLAACDARIESAAPSHQGGLSLADVLAGDDAKDFAQVLGPRTFSFPADHGPHPEFRTEWWYFTGNLATGSGRSFGFQFTLFRSALCATKPLRASHWATRQAYMAHFALTDVEENDFHSFERFSRDALGLAGAGARPFEIWIDDWRVQEAGTGADSETPAADSATSDADLETPPENSATSGADPETPRMRLIAFEESVGLDLVLTSAKPVVLQGDRGRSVKGDDPENASYYYSVTRLDAKGRVTLPSGVVDVTGLAWMDREWSSRALGDKTAGWDWFALQLDNGYDLMLYQLRRKDGSISPHSLGCLVDREGKATPVARDSFAIEVLSRWENGRGTEYPSRWKIRIPALDIALEVNPKVADQELDFRFRYWEGSVSVTGSMGDATVEGDGYVELTGYVGGSNGSIETRH